MIPKIPSITMAIMGAILLLALMIIVDPLNIIVPSVDEIYKNHQGIIAFTGVAITTGTGIIFYFWGVVNNELKECAKINKEKNENIERQNEKIITNQEDYIKEIRLLSEEIIKNNKHDLEALESIQKQNVKIERLFKRTEKNEKDILKIHSVDKRLIGIEKLIKLHDSDISELKKEEDDKERIASKT